MIINDAGTYTLKYTATDECGNETVVNRELVVAPPIYGAEWDGSESSVWTRTDASALFTDPVPQMSDGNGGWTVGSSPFDNIMPWSGMEIVEDAEAGTLVKIPKFYYKWTRNGDAMKLQIANEPQTGFFTSPAHADRGDGVGERDFVYVGRYHCANSNNKSVTGIMPKTSQNRSEFRSNISVLGNDVWQWDLAMYWTVCMLYLVEFADWDSQKKIGGGCSDSASKQLMGLTDNMTYHTGTTNTQVSVDAYGHIQYRHIEDLWANVLDWCDGFYVYQNNAYAIKNPTDFSDNANGTLLGNSFLGTSGVIRSFANPTALGFEYALYPNSAYGDNYDKYICDKINYVSNTTSICVGGSATQKNYFGLFYLETSDARKTSIGSRLMKLPSA